MDKEINLLSGKRKYALEEYRAVRIVNLFAIMLLFIVVILSLLVFFLKKKSQIASIEQQKTIISHQASVSKLKIIALLLVKTRLEQIDKTLTAHNTFGYILSGIVASLPTGVNINKFTINQKKLSVTFSSQSLFSLQTVTASLTDMLHKKNSFKKMTINSLVMDQKTKQYILFVDADIL